MISVVISTYNRLEMLREAVGSVRAQTFPDWELVVVDDASGDGTWEWLEGEAGERMRVFRQEVNRERSAARNRGLAEARGELVMFLDDDDRLLPGALETLAGLMARYPEAVAGVGARIKFRDGVYRVRIPHTAWETCRVIWPELVAAWGSVSGQNVYRTAVVREVGGYPLWLNVVEDRKMWLDVAVKGPVALTPVAVMEYRDHGTSRVPANIRDLRLGVFLPFLETLPEGMAERGRRARAFGAAMEEAGDSILGWARAFWTDPRLAVSPLTGPLFARGLGKALLSPVWRPRKLG